MPVLAWPGVSRKQLLLCMKLSFLIVFLACMKVSAGVYSQDVKVTLALDGVTVGKAIAELEKKTSLRFLYSEKTLPADKRVSLQYTDAPFRDVLNSILANTSLTFKLVGKELVVITPEGQAVMDKTVRGKVTNAKGEPLPGVTVKVQLGGNAGKASATGTVTNGEGIYELTIPDNASLLFSFIGYLPKTITPDGKSETGVVLEEDQKGLNEVVVVGYGTQKRAHVTGSVSAISGKDISNVPVSNISNALAGRLTGLFAYSPSGIPGVSSPVQVRGRSTLEAGANNPIYVIDGIVRIKADFDAIDPNDIETISVLKDAASAAVYGSRGGNGVIMVTTKRGQNGAPKFSYSAYAGTLSPTRIPERLNSYQHAIYQNDGLRTQNVPETDPRWFTPDELEVYKSGRINTDWFKLVQKDPKLTQHNLSVNGGTDRVNYFVSLGYYYESGVFDHIDYKRFNLRSNLDIKLTDNLKMSMNLEGNIRNEQRPYWPWDGENAEMKDFYRGILNQPPMSPAYVNGLPDGSMYHWHAKEVIDKGGYLKKGQNLLNGQLKLTYEAPFLKGLTAEVGYNYNRSGALTKTKYTSYTLYRHNREGQHSHVIGDHVTESFTAAQLPYNFLQRTYGQYDAYTLNASLRYNKKFGKHGLSVLAMYEQFESNSDNFWAKGERPMSAVIDELFITDSDPARRSLDGTAAEDGRAAYIARASYEYADKYLLEASFRYDASSVFPPDNRWGFFPSVSAGWRISEEPFLKNAIPALSNLKLRGSYGQLGNDGGDNRRLSQWYSSFNKGTNAIFGEVSNTIAPVRYANPDITWETVTITDIGLEAGLWNGLLSAEVDYFFKQTKDILVNNPTVIPGTFGIPLAQVNAAQVNSKGLEVSLRHDHTIGQVNYYAGINFSYTKNKVEKYFEAANAKYPDIRTGKPVSYITGYYADGIARTAEDLQGLPKYGARNFEVGDIIFRDVNGPAGKPDGIVDDYDRVVLSEKGIDPNVIFGVTGGFSWKGFDMNLLFQGVTSRKIMFPNRDQWGEQAVLSFWADHWTPENVNAAYPKISGQNGTQGPGSDFWLRDGSYLRLKFIELGYTLPKHILNRLKIERCRFYVSGNNLFTWDKVDLYDPEFQTDFGAFQYPIMKSMNIGVNLGF